MLRFTVSQDALSPVTRSRSSVASRGLAASKFEAASCQGDNLTFATVFAALALILGFDCLFADFAHHLHDIVGLVDGVQEVLIAALEKLEKGPDSDMLEGGVTGGEETGQVAVDTARRLVPRIQEESVIANCEMVRKVY